MKRTLGIHCFISLVLGMAASSFLLLAIQHSSIIYGIFTIMTAIAGGLNLVCDTGESNKKE